ncbi:myosin-G heavy chain-like isoform X2 [Phymastichus coffea]|nr:myosin-G heavy chain-like isoform X2 [Phymastichus coffea]XP_058809313.1 myosin-G heavy chain-like isoform X2 [Phymastichus coffea]
MPQTSFTCRNKIIGSYYADPETDCQLFHVCVSVAGSIQDYRFLCPNDTAFDQESQTCADWYDVDCEAATLYYASDNFDLYRIGSGLESLHYDSIRSDYEPQDHLQRSESNDPIRSPYNSFGNSNGGKDVDPPKKSGSAGQQQYSAARTQKHYQEPEKDNKSQEQPQEKKSSLRKVSRKPAPASNAYATTKLQQPTTGAPTTSSGQARYNPNQAFVYSTTTQRASSANSPRIITYHQQASSTQRPTSKHTVPAATTLRSTEAYTNYQTTTTKSTFHGAFGFNRFESTAKPTQTTRYSEQPPNYSAQYTSQALPSTTKQPLVYDFNQQANYNSYESTKQNVHPAYSVHRTNVTSYPSTTLTPQYPNHNYDNVNANNNANNNHNNHNNHNNYQATKKADYNQNSYATNTYAPTTYSPVTKKFPNHRAFFDKSSTTLTTKSAQYTDAESTKVTKKVTQYKQNYPNFETSTRSYDFGRSSVGLGFSPSSVNHLAENVRPTTPTPRRAASPTTYNPNNFNVNTHAPQVTQPKQSYYQNQATAAKQQQYTTTAKYYEETTLRPKISKKNDYDYAYYDNDPLAYDNIELEHVNSNKESVKIT